MDTILGVVVLACWCLCFSCHLPKSSIGTHGGPNGGFDLSKSSIGTHGGPNGGFDLSKSSIGTHGGPIGGFEPSKTAARFYARSLSDPGHADLAFT